MRHQSLVFPLEMESTAKSSKVVRLFACVLLVWATFIGYRQVFVSWADWSTLPARRAIDSWLSDSKPVWQDNEVWLSGLDQLSAAQKLDPGNHAYPFYMGLSYYVRAKVLPGTMPFVQEPYFNEAVLEYKEAISLNPRVGAIYSALVTSKGRLGQYDQDMLLAFQRAREVAPLEPVVFPAMVSMGLAAWPYLNDATRREVIQLTDRAERINAPWLASFAPSYLRQGNVCTSSPKPLICMTVVQKDQP